MDEYSSITIKKLINDISKNEYFLPAIQRKFVWNEEKICNLFDSIMRDYPIGTFLFWDLSPEKADQYTFYEFLKNYHQRDSKNALVRYNFPRDIRGVLDGQQRISSMYIALQGIFCTKRKHARRVTDNAYPVRRFYLNLLGVENEYEFVFLTDKDANSRTERSYYYLIKNILSHSDPKNFDATDALEELQNIDQDSLLSDRGNFKTARQKLQRLNNKINVSSLINYFPIENKDLDEILDIFVRVNSGGTILSKSDLLFSTLVAHWEDGREHVEKLIEDMNGEDGLFDFNSDFLMRTCLFLIDAPMNFKIQTFNATNITKIKDQWEYIRLSLIDTATMLRGFGFNKTRLSSNYAATPIAYYLYKGGIVDNETKSELRKLIFHSLLKQIFSGQADTALSGLREGLRRKPSENESGYQLIHHRFTFSEYKKTKLSGGKKLTIDADDIEEFLEFKKGAFTYLILSFLYPDLKIDQIQFHQDHMHPYSKFKAGGLKELGIGEENIARWLDMRDQLPNLQLLEGHENTQKQATDLKRWVTDNMKDENYYRERNFLPSEQSLDLVDFDGFFATRKCLLRERLHEIFGVVSPATREDVAI